MNVGNISEFRFHFKRGSDVRKVFKLAVSKSDASLYIFPYSQKGIFYYGTNQLLEQRATVTFDFTQDNYSENIPKLSIHESGRVHVKSQDILAGPLQIPPLASYRGEHLATISPDAISALPPTTKPLNLVGPEIDVVISIDANIDGARIVLYAAGDKPAFSAPDCSIVMTLMRYTLTQPVFIGMKVFPQKPLGEDRQVGVTAIAGFDPRVTDDNQWSFLYIRGL